MVICCIGTPKVKGDSIAPLVGDKLIESNINAYVYGTTERPITARNFEEYYRHVMLKHSQERIIAIDCALGDKKGVGQIKLIRGGVTPGKATGKNLSKIGEVGILAQVGEFKTDVLKELNSVSDDLINKLVGSVFDIVINLVDIISIRNAINQRSKLQANNLPKAL